MVTFGSMAKLKKGGPARRKPSWHVRIRGAFVEQLDRLAKRNGTTGPEEVNRAVRELLEREKLWPASE